MPASKKPNKNLNAAICEKFLPVAVQANIAPQTKTIHPIYRPTENRCKK